MREDLERLKQDVPLLDYLQRHNWKGRAAASRQEFVGLCPLHRETHPSFYVNAHKNLFYCHGCGRGGDLIRFAQLYWHLSFPAAIARLKQELAPASDSAPLDAATVLDQTATFYQSRLHRHPEALRYLHQRGLRDLELIRQLEIGYAPGGNLCRHLTRLGYSSDLLLQTGLINSQGRDAFWRRVIFPCRQSHHVANLYGRSIDTASPHRFLPRPKTGWLAWDLVRDFSELILVEGPFDVAVLWQAGFRNTTCAFGTHLTPEQVAQLTDYPKRQVFLAFDQDLNGAGQQAAHALAQYLKRAGLLARIVSLPPGHDPNSLFVAGATADDFARYLQRAPSV